MLDSSFIGCVAVWKAKLSPMPLAGHAYVRVSETETVTSAEYPENRLYTSYKLLYV